MNKISEVFGSKVFNDKVMREKLPKDAYDALHKHIEEGTELETATANVIASAMKDWALENGATHFTHWFQPMTGVTAEKHDSFMSPDNSGGVIMTFSGKELIKGEPDASSFPSGGIRATFEARGYTAWDPSSYVFIKGNSLCIPTAFCSYGGEALDKKTPLLLSMEALNEQACKVLKLLGVPAKKVISTVGPEQEYFLIPRTLYEQRKDLMLCGRTLIGAKPPKSQELDDHYFGAIKPKVAEYMEDLNNELWKLGVLANTEHNEVAPSQHELAPIFSTSNIAADHNQLTMEIMKKVAEKHDLVCLLHEKPFAGVNGSGKHINWSIATDDGRNLLKPGKKPMENTVFLIFLCAVLKAVDEYQDLLRISVASASNDHRLGGNEAPPSIISIFLGDDLEEILEAIAEGRESVEAKSRVMDLKASVLPDIKKDTTDRNRTSPFAFTGSRFEFRMAGSMTSVSCPSYMINTIVAESLRQFADILEAAGDIEKAARELIKDTYIKHKRIAFNGNNYSDEWVEEAEKRGLLNLKTTVDALPYFTADKNIEVFKKHGIFTRTEVEARQAIFYEEYSKTVNIEALTLIDMMAKQIIPAAGEYSSVVASEIIAKTSAIGEEFTETEKSILKEISALTAGAYEKTVALKEKIDKFNGEYDNEMSARFFCDDIIGLMTEIRALADSLEEKMAAKYWPIPGYDKILFV